MLIIYKIYFFAVLERKRFLFPKKFPNCTLAYFSCWACWATT